MLPALSLTMLMLFFTAVEVARVLNSRNMVAWSLLMAAFSRESDFSFLVLLQSNFTPTGQGSIQRHVSCKSGISTFFNLDEGFLRHPGFPWVLDRLCALDGSFCYFVSELFPHIWEASVIGKRQSGEAIGYLDSVACL